MRRLVLGLSALVAAAAMATPASAHVWVEECYATIMVPCGICFDEAGVSDCVMIR